MTLNIEHAFPIETRVCINCDERPIREGGVALCDTCATQDEANRMNKEFDEESGVDEDHPDVMDYIEYNTFAGIGVDLDCRCD